jgi:hypothetical protein
VNIIGIAGRAGSGKSTVADILVKEHGFVCVSLADPMKRFLKEIFQFSDEQLWGPSEKRNAPDKRYPAKIARDVFGHEVAHWNSPDHLTPRHALQQLGTQWGRVMFEDVWIDYALKTARELLRLMDTCTGYTSQRGIHLASAIPFKIKGVVIPDIRFANELSCIREAGGRIWYRPDGGLAGDAANHLSEAGLKDFKFDAEIPWASSVTDLAAVVAYLLTQQQETSKT